MPLHSELLAATRRRDSVGRLKYVPLWLRLAPWLKKRFLMKLKETDGDCSALPQRYRSLARERMHALLLYEFNSHRQPGAEESNMISDAEGLLIQAESPRSTSEAHIDYSVKPRT